MRGVKASVPPRTRKSCPACGSIAVARRRTHYKCAFCGVEFQRPNTVIINKIEGQYERDG